MKIYRIHTLPILRNEIKMYNLMKEERKKTIDGYVGSLRQFQNDLLEANEELLKIKSPGGDGLGGYVSESANRYNFLIEKKADTYLRQNQYVKDFFPLFSEQITYWNNRIATVEHYLGKLEEKDLEFIKDLYVGDVPYREVKKKYFIDDNSNLNRKARNILKKVL